MKVQTFWNGRLSPYEVLCLKSFTSAGHEVDLYTYGLEGSYPQGVHVLDAAAVLPPKEYRTETKVFEGHPGPFSDHFRYKLLYELGGWWVDTDVILLGVLPESELYFAYQDEEWINNAVMFFPPRHRVMGECLERTKRLRRRSVVWGSTGPYLLTDVLDAKGLLGSASGRHECYPLGHDEIWDVMSWERCEDVRQKVDWSRFLHLWNAVLVGSGFDKFSEPPEGCWLREQTDRLLSPEDWAQ